MPTAVWTVAGLIFLVNLPFGFWRAGLRKFSFPWFVAVHAPVPIAIFLRWKTGLGFRFGTLPLYVAAYFLGQLLGGRLHKRATSGAAGAGGSSEAADLRGRPRVDP